jgi:mono/diheme cytochrome c family protein
MARGGNKAQSRRPGRDGRPGAAGAADRGLPRSWTWALVLAVALGFAGFATEPLWRPALTPALPPHELAARGAALYQQNCAACHGPNAEGQVPGQPNGGTRPDGTYIAPALNGTAHAWHHAPQMLFKLVKDGSPAPDSPMKGWAGKMSDPEIAAVLAYIQSLWPERLRQRYRAMHDQG